MKMHGELNQSSACSFLGMTAVISSNPMRQLMRVVQRIAKSNAAVLITGETGSGKEVVARAIHHHSLRCSRPWIDVNCAALPDHLLESELFGYEKGAFSGADSMKQGLFEVANGGTLFLDEIGELDLKMQVKLLRVLDGTPYYRLGGTRKVAVGRSHHRRHQRRSARGRRQGRIPPRSVSPAGPGTAGSSAVAHPSRRY